MGLTKNEYAIAQALYSNVDIDSVLLSFKYIKYGEEKEITQRLVSVKEIHPTYIITKEFGKSDIKRFNLNKIVEDSCKVLMEAV